MALKRLSVLSLTIEQIEEVAAGFKQDLQREANRMIRRHNDTGALIAIEGMEYIDSFVRTLKLRAGSRLGMPLRSRPIRIFQRKPDEKVRKHGSRNAS